ncbi:DUF3592 domain-containing protein [Microbulbifer sp. SSSA008]|uniref:DUF3592 domain-containing protein n=1 Tax=Microbulbifer sp. SSSA008 TaxID=3243380 RepID=UPI00403A6EE2
MEDQLKKKAKITPRSLLFFTFYQVVFISFLYPWVLSPIFDNVRMLNWYPMDAQLLDVGMENYKSEDGTQKQVVASYEYSINGKTYWNNRVDIHSKPNDTEHDSYHTTMYRLLQRHIKQGSMFSGWYNPRDPYDSVLDKNIRWSEIIIPGLVCFGFIFMGLVVYLAYIFREQEKSPDVVRRTPWLAKSKWKPEGIQSETKKDIRGQLLGGTLAALLGVIFGYVGMMLILNRAYSGLFFIVIGTVGFYVMFKSVSSWLRFKSIGDVFVTITPFPGQIGGKVSGYIQFPPLLAIRDKSIRILLKQSKIVTKRTANSNNKREFVNWEAVTFGKLKVTKLGTRIYFSFNAPDDLPESNTDVYCGDGEYWFLNVSGEIPGDHFERRYELPVFKGSLSKKAKTTVKEQDRNFGSDRVNRLLSPPPKKGHASNAGKTLITVPVGEPVKDFSGELSRRVEMEICGATTIIRQRPVLYDFCLWMMGASLLIVFIASVISIIKAEFYLFAFGVAFLIFALAIPTIFSMREVHITRDYLIRKNIRFGILRDIEQVRRGSVNELATKSTGYTICVGGQDRKYYNLFASSECGRDILIADFIPGFGVVEQLRKRVSLIIGRRVRQAKKSPSSLDSVEKG